ncbi:MAG: hypothetical protein ACRDJ9_09995 [Dehalococcoidia bacterium]
MVARKVSVAASVSPMASRISPVVICPMTRHCGATAAVFEELHRGTEPSGAQQAPEQDLMDDVRIEQRIAVMAVGETPRIRDDRVEQPGVSDLADGAGQLNLRPGSLGR